MPRRSIFSILDDYLSNPADRKLIDEMMRLSDSLIIEAKSSYIRENKPRDTPLTQKSLSKIEPVDYMPLIERIILKEAEESINTSERLIKSTEKLSDEGRIIDAKYVYKVSDREKQLIDELIDKIRKKGKYHPFGLSAVYTLVIERHTESAHGYLEDAKARVLNINHRHELLLLPLKNTTQVYLLHLEKMIGEWAETLPKQVLDRLKKPDGSINIEAILNLKERGQSFYWVTDASFNSKHSSERHPKLYLALDKYTAVKKMLDDLGSKDSATTKVENFNSTLETNTELLKKNPDSATKKFFKSVLHILSFGIYSKVTKGTFKFWKTDADLFIENINESSKSSRPKF